MGEQLIGTVTENKNGLATIRMYNCLPKPLIANTTDEYVKICSINMITVGSILYTVGNQDTGIRFCGIIDITASNNSGGNIKIKNSMVLHPQAQSQHIQLKKKHLLLMD